MIDLLRNKDKSLEEWTAPALQSIKKLEKHGKYSVEVHNGKYSTEYVKSVWKLQYEFADTRMNCFTW